MEKLTLQVMEEQLSFGDELTNDEVLAATGVTKSTYTGKWQVMGLENGKLKLVSSSNVGEVLIGDRDINAIGNTDFDKSVDSWKRAVTTLNNLAKTNTGIPTARSIKIEDIEKLGTIHMNSGAADYGKNYICRVGTFVDEQGNTVKATSENPVTIKSTWYNTTKLQQISDLKIGNSGNTAFLASVCVMYNYGNVFYRIRTIYRGALDSETIFKANSETPSRSQNHVYAIVYI